MKVEKDNAMDRSDVCEQAAKDAKVRATIAEDGANTWEYGFPDSKQRYFSKRNKYIPLVQTERPPPRPALEARDHGLDQALHLVEGALPLASLRPQLRKEVGMVRRRDLREDRIEALALVVKYVALVRLGLVGHLQEDLHAGLEDLLRLGDGRELAGRVLLARRPLGRLHGATLLQLLQVLLVVREGLLRGPELLLGTGLRLLETRLLR